MESGTWHGYELTRAHLLFQTLCLTRTNRWLSIQLLGLVSSSFRRSISKGGEEWVRSILLAYSKVIDKSPSLATRTIGLKIMVVGQPVWSFTCAITKGGLPTSIEPTRVYWSYLSWIGRSRGGKAEGPKHLAFRKESYHKGS
jgi:hypothetical protein